MVMYTVALPFGSDQYRQPSDAFTARCDSFFLNGLHHDYLSHVHTDHILIKTNGLWLEIQRIVYGDEQVTELREHTKNSNSFKYFEDLVPYYAYRTRG